MIYADENVWLPVVEGLRRRDWEVTTALDEGTLGDSDREQLRYAASNGWPVLTFDDDFLRLVEGPLADLDHAGIVYAPQRRRDVGELVRAIDAVSDATRTARSPTRSDTREAIRAVLGWLAGVETATD